MSMIRNFLAYTAEAVAVRVAEKLVERGDYAVIPRDDGTDYLVRHCWTKLLGVKSESYDPRIGSFLHKFVGDDPLNEVHSHPWSWMVSVILSGSYHEIRYQWLDSLEHDHQGGDSHWVQDKKVLLWREEKTYEPFSVNIIQHHHAHRVHLFNNEPCWTLFIHGPRVSGWGFINEETGAYREVKRRTKTLKQETRP